MKVINYRVDLLEPVLVTSLRGDPNSEVAFNYLPGSVLRGIFIGKYLGSKKADAEDSTLQRLFFDGTTRYLNGYPLDGNDVPCLPVPVSWQQVKDNEGEIFDFAVEVRNDRQQWQSVSSPFYTLFGDDMRLIQPARNLAVHTQRTARFGRAMPEYRPASNGQAGKPLTKLLEDDEITGAVYRYDALAAGQTFEAAILCDNDGDEAILRALIGGYVIVGGSRSGGYGRAKINVTTDDNYMIEDAIDPPEDKLIVTLQSDVLLRDVRGQFAVDPELLRQVLSKHLLVDLVLHDAFLNTELVGGFNRKWGLPLPQALAVHMGSVLIFKDPGCELTLLGSLEARGIGERRVEGFGRIAFNRQRRATLRVAENVHEDHNTPISIISDGEAHKLIRLMLRRMLRQRLDEGLLAAANAVKIVNPPSNAQISRLRDIVIKELRKALPGTSMIHQFIKSIEARSSARRQFERSTVNGELLLRWLKRLLRCESEHVLTMDDNEWKQLLRVSTSEVGIRIGGLRAEINDQLRLEYVLRYIDLVLAHAARQRGEEI